MKSKIKLQDIIPYEFKSEKSVIFDPPKKCFVWNRNDKNAVSFRVASVIAYIPRQGKCVVCHKDMYLHMAQLDDNEIIKIKKEHIRKRTREGMKRWLAKGDNRKKHNERALNYIHKKREEKELENLVYRVAEVVLQKMAVRV